MHEDEARTLYEGLARKFDVTHPFPKGGKNIDYLATEQVVSRLTEVLGMDGWSFNVLREGRDGDTLWCVGRLSVFFPAHVVEREQFGECDTGKGMGVGDARKGAGSDALKKCASLVGVGLYLQEKDLPRGDGGRDSAVSEKSEIVRNKWGLPARVSDPMTDARKAALLQWVKANCDLDEQDIVFAMGRPIEEWCDQQETGYSGALQAFAAYWKAKQTDARVQMMGAKRPRANEPPDD